MLATGMGPQRLRHVRLRVAEGPPADESRATIVEEAPKVSHPDTPAICSHTISCCRAVTEHGGSTAVP